LAEKQGWDSTKFKLSHQCLKLVGYRGKNILEDKIVIDVLGEFQLLLLVFLDMFLF
jgi:hypothetical protein